MGLKKVHYTVSDGRLMLTFDQQENGGYVITSPLDPELVTEAATIEEGFRNARRSLDLLEEVRSQSAKQRKAAKGAKK